MNTNTGSTREALPSGRQVVTVLLAGGAIGFFLGMMRRAAWQDALEPPQVPAGSMPYPRGNLSPEIAAIPPMRVTAPAPSDSDEIATASNRSCVACDKNPTPAAPSTGAKYLMRTNPVAKRVRLSSPPPMNAFQ